MMVVRRLADGAVSVTGGERFEDVSVEILEVARAGLADHVTYGGLFFVIQAIEGTVKYRRVPEQERDDERLCRMERVE